ncbi:hypothetical protein SDC9_153787 [bioreactor metagenome]|uniref:Uncharacterized protein n=1 Tax=bioreactor metagenome TaxID=1076179 RepID=A0A645EWX9_9ZZZZ
MIRILRNTVIAFQCYRYNDGIPGFHFLKVTYSLVVDILLSSQYYNRHPFNNQSKSTMFQFASCIGFRMDVRYLLHLQRAFQGYSIV